MRKWIAAALAVLAIACSARSTRRGTLPGPLPAGAKDVGLEDIRVALATGATDVRIGGDGDWRIHDSERGGVLGRGRAGDRWRVERSGSRVRAIAPGGDATAWAAGLVVRSSDGRLLGYGSRHYRGELTVVPGSGNGILVVNTLPIDEYLRGVVPIELGTRAARDSAALQAQAVAARSYAVLHLGSRGGAYDVVAGVGDQAYGGAGVETTVSSRAVESTRGLVLLYGGAVVNAPYSSTCGGETAGADEVWRSPASPYLKPVSDRIPGTDHYYCDIAPRFRWTRTFSGASLDATLRKYLSQYARVPNGDPGDVRDVAVDARTQSGRVGYLHVTTDRGNYVLRGNEIRFVLRSPGGEILNSTAFKVEERSEPDGRLASLTLTGTGYGHGVGMCQWGAIGRARAGQDFATILTTYYPGTRVGFPR